MAHGLVDQWSVKLSDQLLSHSNGWGNTIGVPELMGRNGATYGGLPVFIEEPIAKNYVAANFIVRTIVEQLSDNYHWIAVRNYGKLINKPYNALAIETEADEDYGSLPMWENFCEDIRSIDTSYLTLEHDIFTTAWGYWEYRQWPVGTEAKGYLRHSIDGWEVNLHDKKTVNSLVVELACVEENDLEGESSVGDLLAAFNEIFSGIHTLPAKFDPLPHLKSYEEDHYKYFLETPRKRSVPRRLRFQILERDGFRCMDCGKSPQTHGVTLEVDHRLPFSKGGSNDPSNLRTLCSDCNGGKSDRIIDYPEGHQ